MLSKSQARSFFVLGTGLFTLIFLGLTVDTIRQIPKLTNQHKMSESVVRGKHLFDKENCMGCHTILGEGAYYAPELTKVYPKKGAAYIDLMLQDPQALYPGQRKMVKYDFTTQERMDMIEFLKWISEVDTQGFPKDPPLGKQFIMQTKEAKKAVEQLNDSHSGKVAKTVSAMPVAQIPRPEKFSTLCTACHTVNGVGGKVGPALDGVGSRLEKDYMRKWLKDPQKLKPGTAMPKFPLSEKEIDEMVAYLSTL